MDVVQARWTQNRQFVGWDSKQHGIVMDTPADGSGEGTGWRPVELLLLGMAIAPIYGIVGAVQTSQGQDFKYWIVGDWARGTLNS